ncbi:Endocuticle structural glycoprotein SgAbd-9 [Pseudolycoriella hygida]|uniref:Endocuticle structural glycoprotein SgAbd-9 n=1 Tax=Pseudolycoriella hygida TaxID=35572 RepID=A0A9Q0MLK2_9DIPT|nr:Endocuticle structural glycoprotein SgAbd-9 [Pseudolycoriella hygida]
MKLILLFTFVALTVCAPPASQPKSKTEEKPPVEIIESTFDKNVDGSYTYRFELSDGYVKEEKGVPVRPGEENSPIDVTGFYRYINEEGEPVEIHYTANQYGFVPEGSNIQPEITNNARSLVEAKASEA